MPRRLVALIAVGLVLRLLWLGAAELWYDECFTLLLTRLPISQMIQATAGDTHPPLYYVIMWGWVGLFGESEIALRLPSVLAGVACIPVAWYTLQAIGVQPKVATLAAVWVAVGPSQIYFSQEARMYTIFQLVLLLAVWGVASRRWVMVFIFTALLLWLHNYGGIFAMVLFAYATAREPASKLIRPILAIGLAGVTWLPWLSVLANQMVTVASGYWIEPPHPGDIVYTLSIMLFGIFSRQFVVVAILVTVALLGWALIRKQQTWPLVWLVGGPILIAVVISIVWRPVYLFRGIWPAAPYLYALIGGPVVALASQRRRLVLAAALVPVLVAGWVGYWVDISGVKSNTQDYIAQVRAEWEPGDILYSTSDGSTVTWSAYAPDLPLYQMPEAGAHDRGALSPATRFYLGVQMAELDELEYNRAWILYVNGATVAAENAARAEAIIARGAPVIPVVDTDLVTSGIWLVEE